MTAGTGQLPAPNGLNWFRHLNRYHWYVLIVASLGWLFDTMDQRVFLISRGPAITELLGYERDGEGKIATKNGEPVTEEKRAAAEGEILQFSGIATTIFMLGWATGGLYFGIMGDRWGRARTMLITILIYSVFTGLSALSQTTWDFMFYRFATGLGVGGEFAAGISLVAEVMPAAVRPFALGLLQALSTVGNIIGSMISAAILPHWRYMFLIGTLPALLVVVVRRSLKEPETWQAAKSSIDSHQDADHRLGKLSDLFADPRWRRNTICGFLLALSGVIGLWGVGFWSFELINEALAGKGLSRMEVNWARSVGSSLQDVGAFFGIYGFAVIASWMGRRGAFALVFTGALLTTGMVFGFMKSESDIYWMLPLMGLFNLGLFGGFAVYFPELFPTRLRSTGTGFCYNAARFVAALGPYFLGSLATYYGTQPMTHLSSIGGVDSPLRYAAITVSLIYLLGLLVIPFAPETKGKPLPE